jgi:hypothetical protein
VRSRAAITILANRAFHVGNPALIKPGGASPPTFHGFVQRAMGQIS